MTSKWTRLLSWLGLLGALLCGAGIFGVWYAEWRLNGVREQLFLSVDRSFVHVDNGIRSVQRVLQDSRITIDKVQLHLKDWTREQTGENLEARLQLEAKAEQLVGGLQKAEGFLNASFSIVENVRQLVELGGEAGLPVDTNLVARLSEQIATLQTTVAASCETAEGVRQHVSPEYDAGEVDQNRAVDATKIVAGLLATFSQLDERLSDFAARTTEARDAMGRWNTQVHARLVAMAALATLFLLWMTVGQVCLWRRP